MKTMSRSGWALALVAGLLAPGVATAQTPGGKAAALHDGVVIDAARGAAYVMSPQGGIAAIQLSSGNVMWTSREAAKPLLVKDGVLVAQAAPGRDGVLALVTFDASRGTAKDKLGIEVPEGLRASVVDGPTLKFRTEAFEADGTVVVTWTAQDGRRLQGLLAPEVEAPTSEETAAVASAAAPVTAVAPLRGAARLDLAARKADPMAFEKAQAQRASSVASVKVATSVAAARQLTSLDGRHTVRSERSPEGSLWRSWRWTVTDASGARVGTVDAPVSMAPFVVSGNQILYVAQPSARREAGKLVQEPLRLVAMDLSSGMEVWKTALADSKYRGPFPP